MEKHMLPSPSLFHKFGNRPRKPPDSEPACPKMTHILNISSTVLFSSEKDSISLTLLRNAAELGYPAVYQAMCLRISLTAVYSPLISSSILAWRRMVSQTSALYFWFYPVCMGRNLLPALAHRHFSPSLHRRFPPPKDTAQFP